MRKEFGRIISSLKINHVKVIRDAPSIRQPDNLLAINNPLSPLDSDVIVESTWAVGSKSMRKRGDGDVLQAFVSFDERKTDNGNDGSLFKRIHTKPPPYMMRKSVTKKSFEGFLESLARNDSKKS